MFGNIFEYFLEKQAENFDSDTQRFKERGGGGGASTKDWKRGIGGGLGVGAGRSTSLGSVPYGGGFVRPPAPLEAGAFRQGPNNSRYATFDMTNPEQFDRGTSSSITVPRDMAVDLGLAQRAQPGAAPGGGLGVGVGRSTGWGNAPYGQGFAPIAQRVSPRISNTANRINLQGIPNLGNMDIQKAVSSAAKNISTGGNWKFPFSDQIKTISDSIRNPINR